MAEFNLAVSVSLKDCHDLMVQSHHYVVSTYHTSWSIVRFLMCIFLYNFIEIKHDWMEDLLHCGVDHP